MKTLKLKAIKEKCNSIDVIEKDSHILKLIESQENYSPGRKRPRDKGKEKILNGFKRK
jgi:hypothetical protein